MKKNTSNKAFIKSAFQMTGYIRIGVLCCLMGLFSCKAKKQLVVKPLIADTATASAPVDAKTLKINAIKNAQTGFNTFSGKARTKLDINGSSNDVTLNIHIKHDQKIWVSITAIAGIEVFRALITPDSILVINRLQGLYLKKPFSYVNTVAGSQVNYKTLESLLIGNVIPELISENSDVQAINGNTTLSGTLTDMVYKVALGADMKPAQINLSNHNEGQSLQVVNSAFIQVTNKIMPSQIDMSSMVKDKKILVNLRYIKEEYNQPLDFPFSIPTRYTPAE